MGGVYTTVEKSLALKAHAALSGGFGVTFGGADTHFIGVTALAAAGAAVDYIVKYDAESGAEVGVFQPQLGDIVPLAAGGTIAAGDALMVTAEGDFIVATSTNITQFKAVQAGSDGSVIAAIRTDLTTVA